MKRTLEFPAGFPPPPPSIAADIDGEEIKILFKSSSGEVSVCAIV